MKASEIIVGRTYVGKSGRKRVVCNRIASLIAFCAFGGNDVYHMRADDFAAWAIAEVPE